MALTKADLAHSLVVERKMSKSDAKKFVDSFFEIMKDTIVSGEQIKISSFGNWETRSKNERPGRNPRTGALHIISARRVCVFNSGNKLRHRCNENMHKTKRKGG